MWSISATTTTSASVERVWHVYCDTGNWPRWDAGLARYQPEGPFATGTSGVLQPVGGPELPFTLALVERGRRFVDRTPLGPEMAIVGRHDLAPEGEGARITHTVEIEGPDAEEMARALAFTQEELQQTVEALARYAEQYRRD